MLELLIFGVLSVSDTSVVPPLIYAVMGTSKELAIGPVAVVSMLISSMVSRIVDPGAEPALYRNLVFTATFFAGVFQAVSGLLRWFSLLLSIVAHMEGHIFFPY